MRDQIIGPLDVARVFQFLRRFLIHVRVVLLFPSQDHVMDMIEAYFSETFGPISSYPQFIGATCNITEAMEVLRKEREAHGRIIGIRVWSPVAVAFVNPGDAFHLPAALAPCFVIGTGRAETSKGVFGTQSTMRETLHMDSTFNGVSLSTLQVRPVPGIVVMNLDFAYRPAENAIHAAAGGMLFLTTYAVFPIGAMGATTGIAIGKLVLPYGLMTKATAGAAASRLGWAVRKLPYVVTKPSGKDVWENFQVATVPTRLMTISDIIAPMMMRPPTGSTPSLLSTAVVPLQPYARANSASRFSVISDSDTDSTASSDTVSENNLPSYEPSDPLGPAHHLHDDQCECKTCLKVLLEHYKEALEHAITHSAPDADSSKVELEDFPPRTNLPAGPSKPRTDGDVRAAISELKRKAKGVASKLKSKGKGKQREQ